MGLRLLLVLIVPVLLALAVLVGLGRRTDVVARREWRVVRATRVLGLLAGVAAATWMLHDEDVFAYGLDKALAPGTFGLVVVAFVALGETVVRPPRVAGPRTASLEPRRIRAYLPRPTTVVVATVGVMAGLTLLFTTLTAGTDGSLGGHRVLSCTRGGISEARGPYPGSFYTAPLAAALGLVLGIAAVAAVRVVRRPRGLATTDHGDDALRRRSLTVIVAAVGVAVAFSHAGIGVVAANALLGLGDACAPAWAAPAGVVIGASAAIAFLVGLWCLVRVVSNDSLERPWS